LETRLSLVTYPYGVHGRQTELFVCPEVTGEEAWDPVRVLSSNLAVDRRVNIEWQKTWRGKWGRITMKNARITDEGRLWVRG
jgi:hypothetical protein